MPDELQLAMPGVEETAVVPTANKSFGKQVGRLTDPTYPGKPVELREHTKDQAKTGNPPVLAWKRIVKVLNAPNQSRKKASSTSSSLRQ